MERNVLSFAFSVQPGLMKVALRSLGNIAHPSLSEPVEPCRPTKMSVRYT
jgi:hypothetical protein